jgi:hypothetical protein
MVLTVIVTCTTVTVQFIPQFEAINVLVDENKCSKRQNMYFSESCCDFRRSERHFDEI